MALRFIEGFEPYYSSYNQGYYDAGLRYVYKNDYNSYDSPIYSTSGYNGGYAIMFSGMGVYQYIHRYDAFIPSTIVMPSSNLVGRTPIGNLTFGFRYRHNFSQFNGTGPSYRLQGIVSVCTTDLDCGAILAIRSGCIMYGDGGATTAPSFIYNFLQPQDNNWHYVELHRSSVTGTWSGTDYDGLFTLKLDNLVVHNSPFNYTSDTTVITNLSGIFYFFDAYPENYSEPSTPNAYFCIDDIYITDGNTKDVFGTSAALTGFIPNAYRCKVGTIMPTGNYSLQWSNNVAEDENCLMVADIPMDNDSTYIYGTAVNQKDEYLYNGIGSNALGNVYGIQVSPVSRLNMGYSAKVNPIVNSRLYPGSGISLTQYYVGSNRMFEKNPSHSGVWTVPDLSGMHCGIKFTDLVE